jgi:hypothetical protein
MPLEDARLKLLGTCPMLADGEGTTLGNPEEMKREQEEESIKRTGSGRTKRREERRRLSTAAKR